MNSCLSGPAMKHFILGILYLISSSFVHAEYSPSISTEKSITEIHVFKNWTVRQRIEVVNKVETDQGISVLGEQKISYNSAHEKVRVIKAYTSPAGFWVKHDAGMKFVTDYDRAVSLAVYHAKRG